MSAELPKLRLLSDYLRLYAGRRAETTALSCAEFTLTYQQLEAEVSRYASALVKAGIHRGDVVAVLGSSRPECFIVFLAACRMGAIFLGLNPKYTLRELEHPVRDARPRLVVGMHGAANPEQTDKLRALADGFDFVERVVLREPDGPEFSSLRDFLAPRAATLDPAVTSAGPDAPCAIVYTSGSTGPPKGALLSQRGMIRSCLLSWKYWYGALPDLRTIAQHPINHVGWLVCECVGNLVAGGSTFCRERFDGAETLLLIERERLNLWLAFPSMVMLAMRTPEFATCDLSSLKVLALGTQPSVEILRRLRTRTDAIPCVSYGLTEANGGAVCATDPDADLEAVSSSLGRPLPGVEWRVVGQEGQAMSAGEPGELLIRDECLFLGYLNRPEATAATIDPDGWLHTGDIVAEEADGTLRIVGRVREMYKSGGYNVYPGEIEIAISSHPGVSAVAVVPAPDTLWEEVGVAFVQAKPGESLDEEELRSFTRSLLANYKVPKRFVFVDQLPELPNGKFNKVVLRERAREMAAGDRGRAAAH